MILQAKVGKQYGTMINSWKIVSPCFCGRLSRFKPEDIHGGDEYYTSASGVLLNLTGSRFFSVQRLRLVQDEDI